jgi:uncharacterized protein YkwD
MFRIYFVKFPYTKIASVSASALLTVTLSATLIPAANASTPSAPVPAIQPMLTPTTAVPADSYTAQVFALINVERAKAGVKPLVWNPSVSKVSQDWAAHLGVATQSDSFDFANIHRSDAGGSKIPAGATRYAEIIAFNSTPESIVQWWMNSPGHKAAMLHPEETDIGIGYVVPTSGPYAGWHLVVANLAAYPTTNTSPATPITISAGTQYKTTIQLNLRSGPGTTYSVLGYGNTGTIVTATGKTNGIWYEVKMGSQTGWMSSDYLAKYADATTPAPAPVTQSAIAIKAASLNGSLGYATGSEVYGLKGGGSYQMYQGGAIIYSPASGARVSKGAIRTTWASTGFENGYLGYPVSDEVGGLRNGGAYQNYQGGSIIWSPKTGARISVGGIRTVWAASGYENGPLGYPTGNEVYGLKNGGVYQMYEGGAILWSPATGGYISKGGIRTLWASTGFENGRLGYPTSNEYVTGPNGSVAQNYQGGKINWSPTGSSIVYK